MQSAKYAKSFKAGTTKNLGRRGSKGAKNEILKNPQHEKKKTRIKEMKKKIEKRFS